MASAETIEKAAYDSLTKAAQKGTKKRPASKKDPLIKSEAEDSDQADGDADGDGVSDAVSPSAGGSIKARPAASMKSALPPKATKSSPKSAVAPPSKAMESPGLPKVKHTPLFATKELVKTGQRASLTSKAHHEAQRSASNQGYDDATAKDYGRYCYA